MPAFAQLPGRATTGGRSGTVDGVMITAWLHLTAGLSTIGPGGAPAGPDQLWVSSSDLAPAIFMEVGAGQDGVVRSSCGREDECVIDRDEIVDIDLTDEERFMLNRGFVEWGGPARCTDAMAVGMGFENVQDLFRQADRVLNELDARRPLTRWDWTRTLLATEIVFASDVMGSGAEWSITTGLDDLRSFEVLRSLQHKLVSAVVPVGPRVMRSRE